MNRKPFSLEDLAKIKKMETDEIRDLLSPTERTFARESVRSNPMKALIDSDKRFSEKKIKADKKARDKALARIRRLEQNTILIIYKQRLNDNAAETAGLSKVKQLLDLEEIKNRSMQKVPVMIFDKETKEYRQKIDEETGEGIWEFSANSAISAISEQNKMLGWTGSGGSVNIQAAGGNLSINVIKYS